MRRSVSAVIGVGSEIGKEYIGQISMKTLVSRTWFSASRQAKARNRSSNGWKDENRSMANETLIAKLELNLRQSHAARTRLAARLAEMESEAEIIRAELAEMDTLAGQTEAAILRLLLNVMTGSATQVGTRSVGDLEVEFERRLAASELSHQSSVPVRHNVPPV